MKTLHTIIAVFSGLILITTCAVLVSCSKKSAEPNKQLFTPEILSAEDLSYLKQRGLVADNEKIIYVYYATEIAEGGNILTDVKVAAFTRDTEEKELLQNIFDLSTIHVLDTTDTSTIKVYRKDDTEFTCKFPGGYAVDENFFSKLRTLWRSAISEKQVDKVADTTAGVMLGVKNKKEAEKALKMEE